MAGKKDTCWDVRNNDYALIVKANTISDGPQRRCPKESRVTDQRPQDQRPQDQRPLRRFRASKQISRGQGFERNSEWERENVAHGIPGSFKITRKASEMKRATHPF